MLRTARLCWSRLALCVTAVAGCSDGTEPNPTPTPTPAPTGTIEVLVSTTGPAADPDGYQVLLDAAPGRDIATQGQLTLPGVPVGAHTLTLAGLAPGCELPEGGPRSVHLAAGATLQVKFAVICPGPATLRVVTHTLGTIPDPDGYLVHVPVAPEQVIGVEDTVEITGLPPGNQPVRLSGLAANCATASPEYIVYLPAGQTTTVTFEVTCASPGVGSILVAVSTTAINAPSPLTFTVVLNSGASLPVGSNGTTVFGDLAPGSYSVRLRMPWYCGVGLFGGSGTNPVQVTLASGELKTVRFQVLCIG